MTLQTSVTGHAIRGPRVATDFDEQSPPGSGATFPRLLFRRTIAIINIVVTQKKAAMMTKLTASKSRASSAVLEAKRIEI